MATQVYLVKRYLKARKRNGQREYRWTMRWDDPDSGKFACESTGTADRTQAESLQKVKWAELNGLAEPREQHEPEAAKPGPTWQECREALERAMRADNLRDRYVEDALMTLEGLRRMYSTTASPAEITPDMANEYKRRRAEPKRTENGDIITEAASPWTIRGDLSTLKAVYGKWLVKECGLLTDNPFTNVKPPRCDDPEIRIVSAAESEQMFAWIAERWNNWRLPQTYLDVAALLGWRATEIASMREEDILPDGYVRVLAESSKTRRQKFGWLPPDLHNELKASSAGGWAFGRFSDELRRLLILWKRQPHHAAKVRDFSPDRLVGWIQDELQRFNKAMQAKADESGVTRDRFTLHDFRRTAITGMQMSGVSEKEASVMVGATPEVIRKHYEKLDQLAIARRNVERRLLDTAPSSLPIRMHKSLRAGYARAVDSQAEMSKTVTA